MESLTQWASGIPRAAQSELAAHVEFLLTPHGFDWAIWETFFLTWAVQFVASWVAFLLYMALDYQHYRANMLNEKKLPTRHPLVPFWESQTHMIPVILYNQLVVWPLMTLLVTWPQWARHRRSAGEWGWGYGVAGFMVLMFISDQMWYWSHRLMHVSFCWKHFHKMHHIAEQAALSATFVHPVEYAMFSIAMQSPFAFAGFPLYPMLPVLGWGMFTGSGAHSGYSGKLANADKHNAHHLYHNVNFGLLTIADQMFGTYWEPGDPPPKVWSEAVKVWKEHPNVSGSEKASTFVGHYQAVVPLDHKGNIGDTVGDGTMTSPVSLGVAPSPVDDASADPTRPVAVSDGSNGDGDHDADTDGDVDDAATSGSSDVRLPRPPSDSASPPGGEPVSPLRDRTSKSSAAVTTSGKAKSGKGGKGAPAASSDGLRLRKPGEATDGSSSSAAPALGDAAMAAAAAAAAGPGKLSFKRRRQE